MRAHMERDLREQLVQRGAVLDPETLAKVRVPKLVLRDIACMPALVSWQAGLLLVPETLASAILPGLLRGLRASTG